MFEVAESVECLVSKLALSAHTLDTLRFSCLLESIISSQLAVSCGLSIQLTRSFVVCSVSIFGSFSIS